MLTSHLLLVAIMVAVMVGGILNILHLGGAIARVLKDIVSSIGAVQEMQRSLDEADAATAFHLAGQTEKARARFEVTLSRFEGALAVARTNAVEEGEREACADIGRQQVRYRAAVERLIYSDPPMGPVAAATFCFDTLDPLAGQLRERVRDLGAINMSALHMANERAGRQSSAAALVRVWVSIGAVLVAPFLALRLTRVTLDPFRALAQHAHEIGAGRLDRRIDLERQVEIGKLGEALNAMAERLQEARRADESRAEEAERARERKAGVAETASLLQRTENPEDFARQLLSKLVPMLEAGCGAFFLFEEATGRFRLAGGYGYEPRRGTPSFAPGEGLGGQAALERKPVTVTQVPEGYVQVFSGLGGAPPRVVVAIPVLSLDRVLAVIEVASFASFSEEQWGLVREL